MIKRLLFFAGMLFLPYQLFSQGEVYIVLGSDTGIWEGLDVSRYNHTYQLGLYTDPLRNAYKVMNPEFRSRMKDSYGTPLKLTWWMMSGNTFRYGVNKNVPHANSLPLYLMKKYHGANAALIGDEVSLHYHNWVWTDYDKDGKYYWNQGLTYKEFEEDFNYTLAENLLEEEMFPVSFRSGWHFMNNDWQNYLENVLPLSLHDDYPGKNTDTTEPLDNTYDWSKSSPEFVPFHPAQNNYQIPGSLKGYNVRSEYMAHFSQTLMNHVFEEARKGIDQVVCIWAHLPEEDFLTNIKRIDSLVHKSALSYSDIKFRYTTATEAYKRWLKTGDSTSPSIILNEENSANETFYTVQTSESIFQAAPFLAGKNLSENYFVVPMRVIGVNLWRSTVPVNKNVMVKIGVAATDLSGNLSTKIIKYLPDDIFIDNNDTGYQELYGNWKTNSSKSWENDSRSVSLNLNDSALVKYSKIIPQTCNYNIFFQAPEVSAPAVNISLTVREDDKIILEKKISKAFFANDWNYIGTAHLNNGTKFSVEMKVKGSGIAVENFAADVLKISAIVRDKEISVLPQQLDFGIFTRDDSASAELTIHNKGVSLLTVSGITSKYSFVMNKELFPIKLAGMESVTIPLKFFTTGLGAKSDTLFISCDDPVSSLLSIPCTALMVTPFSVIDNETPGGYAEIGTWFKSVAQAYGSSSRYSALNSIPKNYAVFKTILKYSGLYDIFEIVPRTINASDKALYTLVVNGVEKRSVYIDQNAGSGNWIKLFTNELPLNVPIELKVSDTGLNTVPGAVLRADAVKFSLVSEITNIAEKDLNSSLKTTSLEQNYPNPFNPATTIVFNLSSEAYVTLKIFDVIGREVAVLINETKNEGEHIMKFDGGNLSNGVYFYQLKADNFLQTKKFILLK